MRKYRMILLEALVLALSAAVMLTGCGGGGKDYSALQQDVVKGSSVFVHDSDVVFFGYNDMLCSALFKEGDIEEFVVEAGFTGDVYALAVYDGSIYISASDGIFRYDLGMFDGSSEAAPEVVWDQHLSRFNSFQIHDGKMFFLYGVTLCCVPLEGGEKTDLATEVGDFEVTSEGIFYTKKDGGLHLMSADFKEDKEVGTVSPAAVISLGRDGVYFKENGTLRCCSPDSGKVSDVETGAALGEYTHPWCGSGAIMYSDDDGNYYLTGGDGEAKAGEMIDFPQKYMGYIYKDWLVSQAADYSKLDVISFTDGAHRSYDLADELAGSIAKGPGPDAKWVDPSGGDSQGGKTSGYDIMDGFVKNASDDGSAAYMYFNDFLLIMPNNDKYSVVDDKDSVTIYLWAAQQEGFGGRLVTIQAYDMDDSSYEQLPSYHVAGVGKNVNKRFVAIYPTDVQWNHEDAQQEADYRELYEYLQKIGEGAVNSPLQTADSD